MFISLFYKQWELHDGSARNIEEAILWHRGEAQKSKDLFLQLAKKEREQLFKYFESLSKQIILFFVKL